MPDKNDILLKYEHRIYRDFFDRILHNFCIQFSVEYSEGYAEYPTGVQMGHVKIFILETICALMRLHSIIGTKDDILGRHEIMNFGELIKETNKLK